MRAEIMRRTFIGSKRGALHKRGCRNAERLLYPQVVRLTPAQLIASNYWWPAACCWKWASTRLHTWGYDG